MRIPQIVKLNSDVGAVKFLFPSNVEINSVKIGKKKYPTYGLDDEGYYEFQFNCLDIGTHEAIFLNSCKREVARAWLYVSDDKADLKDYYTLPQQCMDDCSCNQSECQEHEVYIPRYEIKLGC